MQRLALLLVAIVGCSRVESRHDLEDAAVADAFVPSDAIDESRMPFATTGTTPAGSLDDIRFLSIAFLTGFCQPGYYVWLYRTNDRAEQAAVTFYVPMFDMTPTTGTTNATAWPGRDFEQKTEAVSFDIVQLDRPPTLPLRIAGRMRIQMGAWNVDFVIDAMTDEAVNCI